jgi:hypothetical protein
MAEPAASHGQKQQDGDATLWPGTDGPASQAEKRPPSLRFVVWSLADRRSRIDFGRLPQSTRGEPTMRVMVMVKATSESEAGKMPSTELLAAMGHFNEELVKAGVMLAGEGLHPSARGKRVRFSGNTRSVIDGPFAQTKELVAGFWLWQVKSIEEAIEWVRRCPNPMEGDSEIEIRPLFEADDFGAEFTPELRAQEDRLRAEIEGGANAAPAGIA